ncbi:MAG TPA: hypothetical protein VFV19_03610 [Candidatus Polarisedimenticolaceae bacterium]|nr:hypothetical protein [Candidatus Polarisedimenticolaceae bacterium]
MIAHCPACGTHYRHDILAMPMRGRCGRCDAAIDLHRLRPYRLVATLGGDAVAVAAPVEVVAQALAPVEFVAPEPVSVPLAVPLAPAPVDQGPSWENEDPLPPIPEMATTAIDLPAMTDVQAPIAPAGAPSRTEGTLATADGRATTWLLWVAAGAIAGTGISWTVGGTTLAGIAPGTLAGAAFGWGWLRWMSPR